MRMIARLDVELLRPADDSGEIWFDDDAGFHASGRGELEDVQALDALDGVSASCVRLLEKKGCCSRTTGRSCDVPLCKETGVRGCIEGRGRG